LPFGNFSNLLSRQISSSTKLFKRPAKARCYVLAEATLMAQVRNQAPMLQRPRSKHRRFSFECPALTQPWSLMRVSNFG
jgi:hypothetical protein